VASELQEGRTSNDCVYTCISDAARHRVWDGMRSAPGALPAGDCCHGARALYGLLPTPTPANARATPQSPPAEIGERGASLTGARAAAHVQHGLVRDRADARQLRHRRGPRPGALVCCARAPHRVSVSSSAKRRHPTGCERTGSPTLRTLQDPILLLPWLSFSRWRLAFKPEFCGGLLSRASPHHLVQSASSRAAWR
jgi:hypothetical protein